MKKQNGAAIVELVFMAPYVALIIMICVQFQALFESSMLALSKANYAASEAINSWSANQSFESKKFPCLEEIIPVSVVRQERVQKIGSGLWSKEIPIRQEVFIVKEDICADW